VKVQEGVPAPALAAALVRGSSAFLLVYVGGSLTSFGVQLLMARALGASSYGYFVYATSWMPVLLLGCNFGLRPTAVRFVAAYNARRQWGLMRGFLESSTRWTIAASVAVVVVALAALRFLHPAMDELGITLGLVAAAMPLVALAEVWSSALRGLGAVVRSQIPVSIVQHSLLGITLIAIVAVHGTSGGAALSAAALLVATIGTLVVAGALLHRRLPRQLRECAAQRERRAWLDLAGSNLLIAVCQAIRAPLIIVIAGAYVDSRHLAFYGAAQRLANVMSLGLIGISAYASPRFSEYFALSDFASLRRLTRVAARGTLAAALVTALLMIAFGRSLLALFGEGFETAYAVLLILLCGEIAAAAAGPVGFFLTMTGSQATATRIEAVTSTVVLALALALVPRYGIVGAAIVVAIGSFVRNAAMSVAVRRQLALRTASA
jgi:O-antigen/teichoic acid export membrane protein